MTGPLPPVQPPVITTDTVQVANRRGAAGPTDTATTRGEQTPVIDTPVAPPPPTDSLTTTAQAPAIKEAAVLPDALLSLASSTAIEGTISQVALGQPVPDGAPPPREMPPLQTSVVLKTPLGDAALIAPHPFVLGDQVGLRVDTPEARLLVAPISIDTSNALPKLMTLAVVPETPGGAPPAAAPEMVSAMSAGPGTQSRVAPLPGPIAALPVGARLVATVVPLPRPGAFLLVAEAATFALTLTPDLAGAKTAPPLPLTRPPAQPVAGARIEVEIRGAATHLVARVATIDGKPPVGAERIVELAPHPPMTSAAAAASANLGAHGAGLSIGDTVRATVQQAPTASRPAGSMVPPGIALPPAGKSVTLTLKSYGASPTATSAAPVAPTASTTANPTATVAAQATVLGHTHDGTLLVKVADAVLRVETRAPFPPGTTLGVEIVADRALSTDTPQLAPPANAAAPVSFESLEETLRTLAAADPAGHANGLSAAIPRANGGAFANIIAYLLGLRTGENRQWLGERTAQTLERTGRSTLLAKLTEDLAQVARRSDSAPGEWRQYSIPFQDGDRVTAVTAWLMGPERRQDDGEGQGAPEDGADGGTRIVVDFSLSRLGPMRLDGYYLEQRLDLTIRSETPVEDAAQANLRSMFDDVLAVAGLNGGLSFSGLAAPLGDDM